MQETPVWFLGQDDSWRRDRLLIPVFFQWASLVAQIVKNPLAIQEIWVWYLGWEDPLEEDTTTLASIVA